MYSNFGLFKRSESASSPLEPVSAVEPPTPGSGSNADLSEKAGDGTATIEKLREQGLALVVWHGRHEPDVLSKGTYSVPEGQGGDYALVFDNTYSRTNAKTVSFSMMTYSTAMPPPMTHTVHSHRHASNASSHKPQSLLASRPDAPSLSVNPATFSSGAVGGGTIQSGVANKRSTIEGDTSISLHTGYLKKRRRKKGQGWGRRYFSLDMSTSTLSYYHNRRSMGLRGALPLSFATIALSGEDREISLDSGAEVWHLRANNIKDFERWKEALELASNPSKDVQSAQLADYGMSPVGMFQASNESDRHWAQAEGLLGRVAGTRDAVRRLADDVSHPEMSASPMRPIVSQDAVPSSATSAKDIKDKPAPFWKRTFSAEKSSKLLGRHSNQSRDSDLTRTSSNENLRTPDVDIQPRGRMLRSVSEERSLSDHMQALLKDLNSVVADFSRLLAETRYLRRAQRRMSPVSPIPNREESRRSFESTSEQEFFDAEEEDPGRPRFLNIQHDSEDTVHRDMESSSDHSSHGSDDDDVSHVGSGARDAISALFPPKLESRLFPSAASDVTRRTRGSIAKVMPPSLIGFLRKNVGKDLSSISMPVSANEPTSLLQRVAEQLEYSALLNAADAVPDSDTSGARISYVAAFAASLLSNARMKERAIRKPFNPLLGETYELLAPDAGFRFLAEKVSHRPVQLAACAESARWTLVQSPKPAQKFWGKSVEIITEGKIRVRLNGSGEVFSWNTATCFLRNIIAGEKYLDPVGSVTVFNEMRGEKAVVGFKGKGMFSGRSEEIEIKLFDPQGAPFARTVAGKWTESLAWQPSGEVLWKVGELVPDAARCYGMTTFAAGLNEISGLEEGRLPPTDCRLRPDQRCVEDGELERAETVKAGLEEAQRRRRAELEEKGKVWAPRWFERVGEEGGDEWEVEGG